MYDNPVATVIVPPVPNVNVLDDVVLYKSPELPLDPAVPDVPLAPLLPLVADVPLDPDVALVPDDPLVPLVPDVPDVPLLENIATDRGCKSAKFVVPVPPDVTRETGKVQ